MSKSFSQKPLYQNAYIGFVLIMTSIFLALSGPMGVRADFWGYGQALFNLKIAAVVGVFGSILCVTGMVYTRPGGKYRGFGYSLSALILLIPMLVFMATWNQAKQTLPPIQDIVTDTDDPLNFWEAPNSILYAGDEIAVLQQQFYPDIEPLIIPLPADRVFDLALSLLEQREWTIWNPKREELHLEATERTFWFGYTDDVSIQITALESNQSRVDMRSTSRFGGGGDGGTNANRIRAYFKDLQAAAANQAVSE